MDRIAFFNNLMIMAAADGKFTTEEVAFLAVRAEQWGITDQGVKDALEQAASGDSQALSYPEDPDQQRELLCELIRLMAIDGELHEREKKCCATAAAMMDFSPEEFNRVVDELLKAND